MGMRKCKACGRDFASTDPTEEICYVCLGALKRLNGYAVPVVRCKDCVGFQDGLCIGWEGLVREDDFCSYGERREGNVEHHIENT